MATIQEDIFESFFRQLLESDHFDDPRIARLRALFEAGKKPKAADVVDVLSEEPDEVAQ